MRRGGPSVLGIVLATLGVKALLALEPGNLPRVAQVGVDWQVLVFALGLAILVAAILGLLSALRGSRGDLKQAMAQAQRTQAGAGARDEPGGKIGDRHGRIREKQGLGQDARGRRSAHCRDKSGQAPCNPPYCCIARRARDSRRYNGRRV